MPLIIAHNLSSVGMIFHPLPSGGRQKRVRKGQRQIIFRTSGGVALKTVFGGFTGEVPIQIFD
jgi:hypothetical protein